MPVIGQKDPSGEEKTLPRAHHIEAARQTGKVAISQILAPRQQFYG
jgi:hypothetical protein